MIRSPILPVYGLAGVRSGICCSWARCTREGTMRLPVEDGGDCAFVRCLLARDVWTFLLFRTMQAAIVSGFVQSRVIIRDTEPAQKAASLMGYLDLSDRVDNRTNVGPHAWRSVRSTIRLARELLGFPRLWRGYAGLVLVRSRRDHKNPSELSRSSSKHFPVCSDLGASGATRFAWRFQWALSTPFLLPRLSWRQRCFNVAGNARISYGKHRRGLHSVVLSRGNLQRAIDSQQ